MSGTPSTFQPRVSPATLGEAFDHELARASSPLPTELLLLRPTTPDKQPSPQRLQQFTPLLSLDTYTSKSSLERPEPQCTASGSCDGRAMLESVVGDAAGQQQLVLKGELTRALLDTLIQSLLVPCSSSTESYHFQRQPDAVRDGDDWAHEQWPLLPKVVAEVLGVATPSALTFWKRVVSECKLGRRIDTVIGGRARQVHPSPLTPHPSPLTPHPSPLTRHPSPLAPRPSPLTPLTRRPPRP